MFSSESDSKFSTQNLAPAYFLFGPDPFLVEDARDRLLAALRKSKSEVSCLVVDLDETSVEDVLHIANCLPMFTSHQAIVVKGVMKLREKAGQGLKDYFANPSPFSTLIFLGGALDRDDKRKKIFEILEAGSQLLEMRALTDRKLREWVEDRCRSQGVEIDPEAVEFLIEWHGTELGTLSNEIEKLILFVAPEKRIARPAAEEGAGFARGHGTEEFIQALADKDERAALQRVSCVLADRDTATLNLWMIGQQIRQLLMVQELGSKMDPKELGRQLGLNYYFAVYEPYEARKRIRARLNELKQQARQFAKVRLARALCGLAELDHRIKSSQSHNDFYLEMWLHDLIHGNGGAES
ncbi:MAG: DNA polymerase III subunit delta [Acidobacteriota bacterium]